MIIERPELTKDLNSGRWVLVYGRRKTGKTFIVSNFIKHDSFYFIKRDRTVISKKDWRNINYDTMIELMRRDLSEGKTVVIDEFHRLEKGFLDVLHSMDIEGKLILISSTLHLSKELISSSSPLLGKVTEVKVPLISYQDLLTGLKGHGKKYYEIQAFRKEPLVLALDYKDPIEAIRGSVLTVPALIGEIFSEEDRKLSSTYEGVLRSVSVGKQTSGEIASYLFSRKIIPKDDPSQIQPYLANLIDLGILNRVKVWNKKRFIYRHTSPLVWGFYSLDERYNISDRDLSGEDLRPLVEELIPHIMEEILRKAISERTGRIELVDHSPQGEIDGIFVKFNKVVAVIEVKWKSRIRKDEAIRIKEKLMAHEVDRRILVVPDRKMIKIEGIEVLEPSDILDLEL